MFGKTNHIHFVGIGGIGMSGMAELLLKLSFVVTGSDQIMSERTDYLRKLGVLVIEGHDSAKLPNCDVLVYSSAVRKDNPEVREARNRKIPVIRRAEMLGELLKVKQVSIAVSGTHGKTSAAFILGSILTAADLEPTLVIGGIVKSLESNAISGNGDIIVVEADEFDRSFLSLQPTMGIINNLELEHLDCYENMDDLKNTFAQFANAVPFYGKVAVCIDNPNVQTILPLIKRPMITFGISTQADVRAENIEHNQLNSTFQLVFNSNSLGEMKLNVPGLFNVNNALGAISIALELKVPIAAIQKGLSEYSGVWRRFEVKHTTADDIILIDDYAHHPSEVEATLKAARSGWNRRIIAIFQPHLYSRTRDFHQDFARAFMYSDVFIGTEIYPAREDPIPGITGKLITDEAREFGHKNVNYIHDKNELANLIAEIAIPGDMIITMGAGDIWRQHQNIEKILSK